MPTTLGQIETLVRQRLIEPSPSFWTSTEIIDIEAAGCRDLWRATVDLKQEHYLKVNTTDVSLPASSNQLIGVPTDVHKVYMLEVRDPSSDSTNVSLQFFPLDYNHITFRAARSADAVESANNTIYYAITGQGAPVNAPVIYCAPQVTSAVPLTFMYVPTLGVLTSNSVVPIPGEADNALIAWTVAFARAKEREDRSPDANWLSIYSTEKNALLQSLGLRQYQEPSYVDAVFEDLWG